MQIAEAWKVGQKGLDNGVILTVAPNERELRIEVGYGLEGVLPDAIAARIVRDAILPEFRAGRHGRGRRSPASRAILAVISGEELPLPAQRAAAGGVALDRAVVWIALVVLMLLSRGLFCTPAFGRRGMRTVRRGQRHAARSSAASAAAVAGSAAAASAAAGFSGGGGGFGGGGASGRW